MMIMIKINFYDRMTLTYVELEHAQLNHMLGVVDRRGRCNSTIS